MPQLNPALVIFLTLAMVVVINGGLILLLKRRRPTVLKDVSRAVKVLRNPWASEDEALQELSQRVAALQAKDDPGELEHG